MLLISVRTLRHLTLVSLLASFATACAISQSQEAQLGASTAAQIAAQLPLVQDADVQSYINTLGNKLTRVTDTRGVSWRFTVVNSKEINAFAVPGGYIYVNRGLIEQAQDMSQLAGVLGHEIGHVTKRHTVEQMKQAQGANVGVALLCTLTSVCNNAASATAINAGGTALFAKFSRSDEVEADAEGVKTVIKAGISPNGIPAMFRLLLRQRESNPNGIATFFATHPLEESRISATEKQIAAYPSSQLRNLQTDTQAFQTFRRRLMALPPAPASKVQ